MTDDYDKTLYQTRIYKIWANMKSRCSNPKALRYERYGGRGISVCEEWTTFKGFLESLPEDYAQHLTLDRIDNNRGYCKENCRWATVKEQANNRKTNVFFTIDSATKTLAEWCRESKVRAGTIRQRYYVYGWDIKRALEI